MELAITLIELDNQQAPNIGTIICKEGNDNILREKSIIALESHFDCEVDKIVIQDKLSFEDVRNSHPLDAKVYLKDEDVIFNIEIQQTWIY